MITVGKVAARGGATVATAATTSDILRDMRALAFSLAAALGAMIGALLALILKVGANTTCLDVVQIPVGVSGSCALPSAAPWAVAVGAVLGALLAVAATARIRRQRG